MSEIKIITEFTAEDRERIDRMTAAMESLTKALGRFTCDACAATVQATVTKMAEQAKAETAENAEPAQEPKNEPQESVEQEAPATTPTEVEEKAEAKPAVTVKMSDLQQKVVALSAAGKKAEVKAIVTAYAERVTTIPEDKWGEVFEQLTALEG